jgi:hypothetical protein
MRRIASTATLSIFFFLASFAAASASPRNTLFDTVNATMDSSGVSITINQSSASLDGDTSGSISITVSSASTDHTLVCVLDPGSADIDVHRQGKIDVTWSGDDGPSFVLNVPSIHIAGMLSNFSCTPAEPAD